MRDIENEKDLKAIMESFYSKLLSDERIAYFFDTIIKNDLDKHLDDLTSFWAQMLLGKHGYEKNVMKIHQEVDEKHKMSAEHFEIWKTYFDETIDSMYTGECAQNMKDRAYSIAYLMKTKILK